MNSEPLNPLVKILAIGMIVIMVIFFLMMASQGAQDAENIRENEELKQELIEEREAPIREALLQDIDPDTDKYFSYTVLGDLSTSGNEDAYNVVRNLGYECVEVGTESYRNENGNMEYHTINDCYKQ